MTYNEVYQEWLHNNDLSDDIKADLAAIKTMRLRFKIVLQNT